MKYFTKIEYDKFKCALVRLTFQGNNDEFNEIEDKCNELISQIYQNIKEPELIHSDELVDIFAIKSPYNIILYDDCAQSIITGYYLNLQLDEYAEIYSCPKTIIPQAFVSVLDNLLITDNCSFLSIPVIHRPTSIRRVDGLSFENIKNTFSYMVDNNYTGDKGRGLTHYGRCTFGVKTGDNIAIIKIYKK